MEEAFQLLVELAGGDGFSSSSDIATGCVGFAHRRLVCGPPSEHILQLLPPLPLDISPGLPLSAVHGSSSELGGGRRVLCCGGRLFHCH